MSDWSQYGFKKNSWPFTCDAVQEHNTTSCKWTYQQHDRLAGWLQFKLLYKRFHSHHLIAPLKGMHTTAGAKRDFQYYEGYRQGAVEAPPLFCVCVDFVARIVDAWLSRAAGQTWSAVRVQHRETLQHTRAEKASTHGKHVHPQKASIR